MSKFILLTAPNNTAVLINTDCIEGALVDGGKRCTKIYPAVPQSEGYVVQEKPEEIYKLIEQATTLPEPVKCAEGVVDKWHDLIKNPNDLPPIERFHITCEVLVYDNEDVAWLAYYSYEFDKWFNTKTGAVLCDIVKWRYTD